MFLLVRNYLSGCGIAARNWWKNRFQRLLRRFLQLRPVLITRIFHWLSFIQRQARYDASNLDALQSFSFQQALRQTNHHITIVFNDALGALILRGNDLLDLLVDANRGFFREVAVLSNLTPEEDLLFLFTERQR